MFNIERELEYAGQRECEVRDVRVGSIAEHGEVIFADLWDGRRTHGPFLFNRKTGVMLGSENDDSLNHCLRAKSGTRVVHQFFLIVGEREWPRDDWVKLSDHHYSSGADAAAAMKSHNEKAQQSGSPMRFAIRKETQLSPISDYVNWARERFETGLWSPVPWANEEWATHAAVAHHFAHISMADEFKVAFWASEELAQQDSVTIMSPGRYLKQYFGDFLDDKAVRDWAVKLDAEAELKILEGTEENFYHAYRPPEEGGLASCMTYRDNNVTPRLGTRWTGGKNPVRVYAAGDLAMAVLERKNKMIARALVWPEKMVAGRIYGDIERMTDQLEKAGYKLDCRSHNVDSRGAGGFNGARLKIMRPENLPFNLLMPYVDYGYRISFIEGDDEHVVLDRSGAYSPTRTDGVLWYPGEEPDNPRNYEPDDDPCDAGECDCCCCCERCDMRYNIEDLTMVRTTFDTEQWCRPCREDIATRCDHCSVYEDYSLMSNFGDGTNICRDCYDREATICYYCDEAYMTDDMVRVYDARYELSREGAHPEYGAVLFADACSSCVNENSHIQLDLNGVWVDVSTFTECNRDSEHIYSGNLGPDECPHPNCVEARQSSELELESA